MTVTACACACEQLRSLQAQAGSGEAVCQRAAPVFISSAVKLPDGVRGLRQQTGDGDIEIAVIRGAAPGNAAGAARDPGRPTRCDPRVPAAPAAAVADFRLPQNLAAVIGIQSVDDAGLLSRQQDLIAGRQRPQHGGTRKAGAGRSGIRPDQLLDPAQLAV